MSLVFKTPKSTLNTTTGEGQNIGYGDCPECPECPKVELSDVDVKYTENGEYTLTPEGDGFSSVGITVNIDTQAIEDAAYAEGEAAGIITGKAEGIAEQKAKLTSTTITENGTTTREDGWNSVTVNVDVETPYNNGVVAGEAAQKAKLESATFVSNGTYTKEDGYNEVTVNVPSDVNNQTKNVTISSNGTETITADSGYSGLGSVEVTVDVQPNLDVLTVTPSTQSQQFLPESGYDGFSQVDVNPVTSAIDNNITASNIKKDVTILGVTGSYDPQPDLETKTVAYTANNTYTIIPTAGKDGISLATVTVNVPSNTVETGATYTADTIGTHTIEPSKGYDGMDSVELTVNTDPLGSLGSPFDDYLAMLKIDFEGGCYYSNIASGRINETTGYYDAESGGEVLHIKPYISDGGDPATYSFPEDFDLKEKDVVVYFLKENATLVTDKKSGNVIGVDINECELVSINGNANPETWPFGTLRVTENGSVDPTGYAEIDVEVNPTLQTKSVVPSDRQQVITPDRDYDGLSEVTVSGVTAAIDQNITASNIKDGVTILGVTGTYDPQPSLESKTASYTANGTYTITPSTGYDGIDEVEVTVNVAGGSGTQCPDWSSIGWDCNDIKNSGLEADLAYTAQKKAEYENSGAGFAATDILFAPKIAYGYGGSVFSNCTELIYIPDINFSSVTKVDSFQGFAQGCSSLHSCGTIDFAGKANNLQNMFNGCQNLERVKAIIGTENVDSFSSAFYNCYKILEIPTIDTSSNKDMSAMFASCRKLVSIPQLDASNVTTVYRAFGSISSTTPRELTTLGGFINLGKAFVSTDIADRHLLNLQNNTVLTKESIMNVINNLAAPDDTAVTDATLSLSATSYALLTEEDIAIATAKRWSVVSA